MYIFVYNVHCTQIYFRYSMTFKSGMEIQRKEKESVPESLVCNGVGDVHDKQVLTCMISRYLRA